MSTENKPNAMSSEEEWHVYWDTHEMTDEDIAVFSEAKRARERQWRKGNRVKTVLSFIAYLIALPPIMVYAWLQRRKQARKGTAS
jgi:hypothetical protein